PQKGVSGAPGQELSRAREDSSALLGGASYSLRAGRRTAMTKCAKFDAPSSSCSQRTTQCSARYFATRVSGIPRYCPSCGLIEDGGRQSATRGRRFRGVLTGSNHCFLRAAALAPIPAPAAPPPTTLSLRPGRGRRV